MPADCGNTEDGQEEGERVYRDVSDDNTSIGPRTGGNSFRPWAGWIPRRRDPSARWVPVLRPGTRRTCLAPELASIQFPYWPAADARAPPWIHSPT